MTANETATAPWQMHACRSPRDGSIHTVGRLTFVQNHLFSDPIIRVLVEEVAEDDETATHWGWMRSAYAWHKADTEPNMIWPRRIQFDACFDEEPEAKVARGYGRIVRLRITEIEEQ